MNPVEIIRAKRDGGKLSSEQIKFFIDNYLEGEITDYQMSAFLMAVFFRGMNDDETFALTETMIKSGKVVDLSFINGIKVDKHSTGGVGDKTSLILAPLAAACGIYVPMISGRGLGHTGGTLDKLESIPGFNVNLSIEDYKRVLAKLGVVMIGQTAELAPADKRIYALRDVTATVNNISLITASIMSKKIAEGADAIVFDVKIGSGANLPDEEESKILAKKLVSVSRKFGKKAIAVLTDMSQPLGKNIGNWLEVEECLELLNGVKVDDLSKVNNVLAGAMIYLGGKVKDISEGEKIAQEIIDSGKAFGKFLELVREQGGDVEYLNAYKKLKRPEFKSEFRALSGGFITKMEAHGFGMAAIDLGCGRKKADDKINFLSGIVLKKKYGDKVLKDDLICEIWSDDIAKNEAGKIRINDAVKIEPEAPPKKELIIDILE
jgi:pyrimidine-nucleoside phosphorylase